MGLGNLKKAKIEEKMGKTITNCEMYRLNL